MRLPAGLALAGLLAACSPSAPEDIDPDVLAETVGSAIGDAGTCVLLVERGTAKVVWRYGSHMTCDRERPSCVGSGYTSMAVMARRAADGDSRRISCGSPSGRVAWATGVVPARDPAKHNLAYVALMDGDRSLPAIEVSRRLEAALARAGI